MLLVLIFAVLIIGIVLLVAYDRTDVGEWAEIAGMISTIVGGIAVFLAIVALLISYCGVDGYVASKNVEYESLVYQYENNMYDNDNDVGKQELMTQIQEWNAELAKYQAIQDDPWIGIFIPNIYDQFEFIELH